MAAPAVREIVGALGGMVLFGLCAGLGAGDVEVTARVLPAHVGPLLGALLLTAPALLVVHQFLGLQARPGDLVAALAHGVVGAGRVAAGLAPVALFFAATTSLWVVAIALGGLLIGLAAAATAAHALCEAEWARGSAAAPRFRALLGVWLVLGGLICLRLAVDVARFIGPHHFV
jgi:hypothetical protein